LPIRASRTSVTLAERILQNAGIIKHRRGGIQIIDGDGKQFAPNETSDFMKMLMGWRSQENHELTTERVNRLPWRDRKIIQRAGWVAALVILFACIVAAMR
jgi:hypothetical protein